ncbi:flavin reductase family protein [candidate division KSB1 bacterium]
MGKYVNYLIQPVTILSVKHEDKFNFCTAAWISTVSMKPPLVMAAIHLNRFTHDLVIHSDDFCINILADDQVELSELAGTISGRNRDKSKIKAFKFEESTIVKSPQIKDCAAFYECRKVGFTLAGDHTLFTGEILNSGIDESKNPLLRYRSKYYKIGEIAGK